MENFELFYPEILVLIGSYRFTKGLELVLCSSEDSYYDWAKIAFNEEYKGQIDIKQGDRAIIKLGYNSVYYDVFTGYVIKGINESTKADEILLKDNMLLLEKVNILNTFINATPQEIISYVLSLAGIENINITSQVYVQKKLIGVRKKSGIQTINQVNAEWSLKNKFYFRGDTFYWGVSEKQTKMYVFEYGSNIISLGREGTMWELVTVSAPFIHHGEQIKIIHPKLSGTFTVKKIRFVTNGNGFIRTTMYF